MSIAATRALFGALGYRISLAKSDCEKYSFYCRFWPGSANCHDRSLVEQTEERVWEAEIHRLSADVVLAHDSSNPQLTEARYRQAIDVGQSQGAKSLELRTTTSLARLWQIQGKRDEARHLLAPIYNWFTEGFDTADLKEAKALLNELA